MKIICISKKKFVYIIWSLFTIGIVSLTVISVLDMQTSYIKQNTNCTAIDGVIIDCVDSFCYKSFFNNMSVFCNSFNMNPPYDRFVFFGTALGLNIVFFSWYICITQSKIKFRWCDESNQQNNDSVRIEK